MRGLKEQSVELKSVNLDVLLSCLEAVLRGYKCQRKLFEPSRYGSVFAHIIIEQDPVPVPPFGKYDFKSDDCDLVFWWGKQNGAHVTRGEEPLALFIAATDRSLYSGEDRGNAFAFEIKQKIEKELIDRTGGEK